MAPDKAQNQQTTFHVDDFDEATTAEHTDSNVEL